MKIIVCCDNCLLRETLDMKSISLWKEGSKKALNKGDCQGWPCPDCGTLTRIIKYNPPKGEEQ